MALILVDDALEEVLRYLSASDLCSCSLVSRQFYSIATLVWKTLCQRDFGGGRFHIIVNDAQVTKIQPDYHKLYKKRYDEWNRNHARLLNSPIARLPSQKLHEKGFLCGIHVSLLSSPDFAGQFMSAYRFVLSQTWLELECTHSESRSSHPPGIPRIVNVCLTPHPLILQVIPADFPRTWLCFSQTMEILDAHEEGTIVMAYRRLLECDHMGQTKDSIKGWREEQLLQRLLAKQQTLLLSHPLGIAHRVREDETGFHLARRYVFQNSKFSVSNTNDETQPIHPWLGPLDSVNSVVAPPCFGSNEICMIQCALGFSRILVLCETGQIVHSFVESPHSPVGIRSSIWKRLLGIVHSNSFKFKERSNSLIEYMSGGTILLTPPPLMNDVGPLREPEETQSGSDKASSYSDEEIDLLIRVI